MVLCGLKYALTSNGQIGHFQKRRIRTSYWRVAGAILLKTRVNNSRYCQVLTHSSTKRALCLALFRRSHENRCFQRRVVAGISQRKGGNDNIWSRRESTATPITRANVTLNTVRAGRKLFDWGLYYIPFAVFVSPHP